MHTGEKPYICTFEGFSQAFKAHGHLKVHTKRHSKIGPYECEICGSKFARKCTLRIHFYIHSNIKPFSCRYEGCYKRYTELGNMKTHCINKTVDSLSLDESKEM